MNQFEFRQTRIVFVIINSLAQSNDSKIQFVALKVEEIHTEIADLIYCNINSIATSFYLILSEAYSEPCQKSKMEGFGKMISGWITLTIFEKALS